jgi:hypothetical protein
MIALSGLPKGNTYEWSEAAAAAFNRLGREGWEFVGRPARGTFVFARPRAEAGAPPRWQYRMVDRGDPFVLLRLSNLPEGRAYSLQELTIGTIKQLEREGWEYAAGLEEDVLVFKRARGK